MTTPCDATDTRDLEKVVIPFESGTVKGYLESCPLRTLDELLINTSSRPPKSLRVRRLGASVAEELPLDGAKAIFYVKEFEGNSQHKDLHFYTRASIVHGIWVRVEFLDGEVMEGIVENTIRYLLDLGFALRPTDPNSNNTLVYVLKCSLKDYRVLGLRNL